MRLRTSSLHVCARPSHTSHSHTGTLTASGETRGGTCPQGRILEKGPIGPSTHRGVSAVTVHKRGRARAECKNQALLQIASRRPGRASPSTPDASRTGPPLPTLRAVPAPDATADAPAAPHARGRLRRTPIRTPPPADGTAGGVEADAGFPSVVPAFANRSYLPRRVVPSGGGAGRLPEPPRSSSLSVSLTRLSRLRSRPHDATPHVLHGGECGRDATQHMIQRRRRVPVHITRARAHTGRTASSLMFHFHFHRARCAEQLHACKTYGIAPSYSPLRSSQRHVPRGL